MQNNELLRRVCGALAIDEEGLLSLVALAGLTTQVPSPAGLLLDAEQGGHLPCDDPTLLALLDAIIEQRRGPSEGRRRPQVPMSNNLVLKKLRIAMGYQDADMLQVFAQAGVHMGRNQLGSLFRAPGNSHFQDCSDGTLLCFLTGLQRRVGAEEDERG
jgi:uncharacterized protein YehS (DUF1456 family)